MIDFDKDISEVVLEVTDEGRAAADAALVGWLATRLSPTRANVATLFEHLKADIAALCADFHVAMGKDGKLHAVSTAHAETLALLTRGTRWFDGGPEAESLLIANGIFSGK